MPALFAHYYMAQSAASRMPADWRGALNPDAFIWGSLGPDSLFFHRAFPPRPSRSLRKYGSRLHQMDPAVLFEAMFTLYESGAYTSITQSYIYGFICHYGLDRAVHPFIYALEEQIMARDQLDCLPIFIHNLIEHNIDVHVLQRYRGVGGHKYCAASVLPVGQDVLPELAGFMAELMNRLFGRRFTERELHTAFADTRRLCRWLFDRTGRKRRFFIRLERLLRTGPAISSMIRPKTPDSGTDFIGAGAGEWRYPADGESGPLQTEGFFTLTKRAAIESATMLSCWQACRETGQWIDFTRHISFASGRPYTEQ